MEKRLWKLVQVISIVSLLSQSGCGDCQVEREFNHPARPSNVQGWKKFENRSVTVDGEFVLSLGESVHNGRVGIRIVSLTPAKCRLLKEPETPAVRMEFYNVPDRDVICESTFQPGSAFLRRPHVCGEHFEWDVIGIKSINAKEKWIAFELVK